MGNSGSVHNLQYECVDSELNSYYAQQYLRRTQGEIRRTLNENEVEGWSNGGNVATDCKVLPKPAENLKLRATRNGAILQAGGTISLRTKDHADVKIKNNSFVEHNTDLATLYPMRRCRTLILEGQKESISYRKFAPPAGEFRRSKTLLHVDYKKTRFGDSSLPNFDGLPQTQNANTTFLKANKYNKKRKAPLAPSALTKFPLEPVTTCLDQNRTAEAKSVFLAKPRIYTTNSNKILATQKLQQKTTNRQMHLGNIDPFERDSKTSVNCYRASEKSNLFLASKLPYRREKSFDAELLKRKEKIEGSDGSGVSNQKNIQNADSIENNTDLLAIEWIGKNKIYNPPLDTQIVNKTKSASGVHNHLESNYRSETYKVEEVLKKEISPQFQSSEELGYKSTINERRGRATKCQQSRIPQLKRTFYFGMDQTSNRTPNRTSIVNTSQTEKPQEAEKNKENLIDEIKIMKHNIGPEEEIQDNGILVHVRPTLPRRQPETPTFSPAAAWCSLLEAQQRLQPERFKLKHNKFVNANIESPICFPSNTPSNYSPTNVNWTPQQDLEDDNDDVEENEQKQQLRCKIRKRFGGVNPEPETQTNFNSLHIFSLSLPRDVHLQYQTKSMLDYKKHEKQQQQQNNLKPPECWLVPGFNSLKKFKTQLDKNLNNRSSSNTKCTCAPNLTIKGTIFSESAMKTNNNHHQKGCQLHKTSPQSLSYHNDNWFLNKSQTNKAPLAGFAKNSDQTINYMLNSNSLINLEPKSLTNICGGKHIVYLPSPHNIKVSCNKSNNSNNKTSKEFYQTTTKSIHKRPYQRQEIHRESLQDVTLIQEDIHQSNVCAPEKDAHRFSFQSTARILEKRRLAEKLSKDAEIQEAQRLNELEAMKRVEEDFQRKRAPEKASLRNQLRLHLKANTENEEYGSLPLNIDKRYDRQPLKHPRNGDANNNLFCRAEPDGSVSPSSDVNDNGHKTRLPNLSYTTENSTKQMHDFETDQDESQSQVPDMQLIITY